MFSVGEFIRHVYNTQSEHKILLARIALNALHDPAMYPVDISELQTLSPAERVMVAELQSCLAENPGYPSKRWTATQVQHLINMEKDNRTPSDCRKVSRHCRSGKNAVRLVALHGCRVKPS